MSYSRENENTSPKPTRFHKLDAGLETREGKKKSSISSQDQQVKHTHLHVRSELKDLAHIEAGQHNEDDRDPESKSTEVYERSISLSKALRDSESFRQTPRNSERGFRDVTDPILMDPAIIYSRKKADNHGEILLHWFEWI